MQLPGAGSKRNRSAELCLVVASPGLGGFLPVAAAQECRGDAPVALISGKGQAVTVTAVVRPQTAAWPTRDHRHQASGCDSMTE